MRVAAIVLAVLLTQTGCIEITGESRSYICVVSNDTIGVPRDTTGIRCTSPDSLPEF